MTHYQLTILILKQISERFPMRTMTIDSIEEINAVKHKASGTLSLGVQLELWFFYSYNSIVALIDKEPIGAVNITGSAVEYSPAEKMHNLICDSLFHTLE